MKFLFTSGSTKMPKAVINTQRMWCANQQQMMASMPVPSGVRNADRSKLNPLRFLPAWLEVIEKINGAIENATRFAAFQAARSEGKTVAQALREH